VAGADGVELGLAEVAVLLEEVLEVVDRVGDIARVGQ
jgi:hypothetical protein